MTTVSSSIRSHLRRRMLEFDTDFKDALKEELEPTAKRLTTRFRRVVTNWKIKPVFSHRITINKDTIRLTVYPKGAGRDLFLWTDRGTKAHIIRAKNVPLLRFQVGYHAKTQPVAKYNQGDGSRFGDWRSAKQVNHPGTEARRFGEKFKKDMLPDFQEAKETAFKRAIRHSERI